MHHSLIDLLSNQEVNSRKSTQIQINYRDTALVGVNFLDSSTSYSMRKNTTFKLIKHSPKYSSHTQYIHIY